EWVSLGREAGERRHRLALASSREEQQLRRRNSVRVFELDGQALRHLEKAELLGGLEVGLEASSHHGHPPLELDRHAHEMLDAMDVGGEVGNHDSPGSLAEE